jgi:hypothetical protein
MTVASFEPKAVSIVAVANISVLKHGRQQVKAMKE